MIDSNTGVITVNDPDDLDYEGTNPMVITVQADDGVNSSTTDVDINLNDLNDPPSVGAVISSASEDAAGYTVDLLSNSSDPDTSDTLSVTGLTLVSGDASGITDNGDGTLDVDPSAYNALAQGESEVISYSYDVTDGTVSSGTTVTITITGANDGPTVGAVMSSASEDAAGYTVDLLSNSSDPDTSDTLSVTGLTLVSGDASGITDNGDGTLDVDPSAYNALAQGESEVISYSYDVTDGTVSSGTTVTITITGANDGPTVGAVMSSASEDAAGYTVDLLSNSSDPDTSDTLSVTGLTLVSGDASGITDNGDGTLDVDPSAYDALAQGESEVISYSYDVTDGTVSSGTTVTITITGANDGPTITSTALTTATEDSAYSYTFTASDVDTGDTLTLSAPTLPGWLSFDPATGVLSGTPTNAQVGTHNVVLWVNDGTVDVDQGFTITVANSNDAPVLINPIPDQSATEDLAFSFQFAAATFNDVDAGDTLSYRAQQTDGSTLPSWLGFDAPTRTFAGTPGNADVGTLRIEVIAEDGSSATVSDVFNLSVANSNDAPHGLSLSDNEVDDQTDTVGGHKVGDLTGADLDAGDVLTYSIVGGADQAHFSLANGDDLLLDDGVLDRAAQASYQVTIRVTDAGGLTLDVPVTVNVVTLVAASAPSSPLPTGTPSLPSVPTVTGLPIGIVPADAAPADAADGDADEEAEEAEEAVTEGLFAEETSNVDLGPALVEETFSFDVAQSPASNGGAAGVRVGSVSGILAGLRPLPAQQGLVLESVAPAPELQDQGGQGAFRTSDQMYQYFDDLRESLRQEQQSTALTVGSSVAMTSGFSVGYVVWLLRGGVLASTVLSSLPAWQFLDPLPVLARVGSDDDEDEESLDSIIKKHEVAADTVERELVKT